MGLNSTNVTLDLPELPEGMKWDDSALYASTGVLSIIEDTSTGIASLPASARLTADVYNADGSRIARIKTTKQSMQQDVRRVAGVAGTYVLRFIEGTNTDNIIIVVR